MSLLPILKKYKFIKDFKRLSSGAYHVAEREGWIENYTWLKRLPPQPIDYERDTKSIYAYEFAEYNSVYVGLTNSMMRRDWQHRNNEDSSVYQFASKRKCEIPQPKILERNIPTLKSGSREAFWVEFYKKNSWTLLNKAKTGERESSLGAYFPLKWNKKTIKKKAKECDYDIKAFMATYPGAYGAILSRYRGLLDELFPSRMIHHHHTIEEALNVVRNGDYNNRSQLRYKCLWAYRVLFDNGILDEVFGKPKQYSQEEALSEASNYRSIEQIRHCNHALWTYLRNNNLFKIAKPNDPMFHRVSTVEEAWEISMYYPRLTDLRNHAKAAYKLLKDNNLLEKRYPNSIKFRVKKENIYSYEDCKKCYEDCMYIKEVKARYPEVYKKAKEKGWHDELKSFLKNIGKKWTKEKCWKVVQEYTNLKEFYVNAPNVYNEIKKNHWDDLLKPLKRQQHEPYNYSLEEIKTICAPYHNLLELSKARKDIDNYCRRKGIDLYELNGWKNLRNRSISQISDGVEVAVYSSISKAAKAMNVPRNRMWEHIGKDEPYLGYVWKYKED